MSLGFKYSALCKHQLPMRSWNKQIQNIYDTVRLCGIRRFINLKAAYGGNSLQTLHRFISVTVALFGYRMIGSIIIRLLTVTVLSQWNDCGPKGHHW